MRTILQYVAISIAIVAMVVSCVGYLGSRINNALNVPDSTIETPVMPDHRVEPERPIERKSRPPRGILNPIIDPILGIETSFDGHLMRTWSPLWKNVVLLTKQKAFIKFGGEGCLDCYYQWAAIDDEALAKAADEHNVLLFDGYLNPGEDNSFVLKELSDNLMGGVPGYVFIGTDGKYEVFRERLRGAFEWVTPDNTHILVDKFKELK